MYSDRSRTSLLTDVSEPKIALASPASSISTEESLAVPFMIQLCVFLGMGMETQSSSYGAESVFRADTEQLGKPGRVASFEIMPKGSFRQFNDTVLTTLSSFQMRLRTISPSSSKPASHEDFWARRFVLRQ